MHNDPKERIDLMTSNDPMIQAALARLVSVAGRFPARDNDPKYRRRTANDWDAPVTVKSQIWKK